jgi:hypothetical protein
VRVFVLPAWGAECVQAYSYTWVQLYIHSTGAWMYEAPFFIATGQIVSYRTHGNIHLFVMIGDESSKHWMMLSDIFPSMRVHQSMLLGERFTTRHPLSACLHKQQGYLQGNANNQYTRQLITMIDSTCAIDMLQQWNPGTQCHLVQTSISSWHMEYDERARLLLLECMYRLQQHSMHVTQSIAVTPLSILSNVCALHYHEHQSRKQSFWDQLNNTHNLLLVNEQRKTCASTPHDVCQ